MKEGANNQKIKLLKLVEMLGRDTDEDHPMTTEEIIQRLAEMNISCDAKTVGRDMKYLNANGYEVLEKMVGHKKGYFMEGGFETAELKIILDAVQALRALTQKKTEKLTNKIAALGGSHKAELLKENIVQFSSKKHTNESIFYNVHELERAISKKVKVTFQYYDLDERRNMVLRKDGELYEAEPICLQFDDENYYLVSYNSKYGESTNYRVDRMKNVTATDEELSPKAAEYINEMEKLRQQHRSVQTFKMFNGNPVNITLRFTRKLIGSVFDKFGEDTEIKHIKDDIYNATVKVAKSPTFYSWVFQFNGEMNIISPESVADEYLEMLKRAADSVK